MSTTVTATQAATIKAIVNFFETGHVLGDYGQVTVLAGDTGHLTFGRSQTTLGSGNLHKLLERSLPQSWRAFQTVGLACPAAHGGARHDA